MFSFQPFRLNPARNIVEIFRCNVEMSISQVDFSAFSSRLFICLAEGVVHVLNIQDLHLYIPIANDPNSISCFYSRSNTILCPPAGRIYAMVIANQSVNSFVLIEIKEPSTGGEL